MAAGGARSSFVARDASRPGLVHPEWWLVGLVLGASIAVFAAVSRSGPPVHGWLGAALALPLLTPVAVRLERRSSGRPFLRYGLLVTMVGLPLAAFSALLTLWAGKPEGHGGAVMFGLMASTSLICSVLLTKRPLPLLVAQIALWTGFIAADGTVVAVVVLGIGFSLAIHLVRRERETSEKAARRRAETERHHARAADLLADFEQTGQGWFWETDRHGRITYVSARIGSILGRDARSLIGVPVTALFDLSAENQRGERILAFHLSSRSSFQELAVRAAAPGDEERWWSISGRPVYDHLNNFIGFRGSGTDLTERKKSEEKVTRLAHYDSLTSLANRLQMSQTLEKILNAPREEQRRCAIFLLDLDRFKQVNDTLGHPVGDALLTHVAQRLECTVGAAGRVGRLGGDEFQVIVPGNVSRNELAGLAEAIIEYLSQPYSIEGHSVVIGASVGIAVSPDDGVTSESLIRNADLALYAAKDGGRGRFHFYAADLHSDAEERRLIEHDLREAIVNGGLELYYQPVVQTTTEKITGFEALLRWNHPRLGILSPAKFISVAEDTGQIAAIGEWALRTACQDLAKWPDDVRVAVNVSPLQFANPALPAIVTSALAAAQVHPSRLELEITESVFLNDGHDTDAMFAALKRVGVRLALDDFGTGYSSLGYLKNAPFDKIKVDQSFVRGATTTGSRNAAIISSIVSLAESLGMETTAEGVETLDELDLVRMLGCSHVQGFIYDKPLSADLVLARLQSGLVAVARGPRSARARRKTMLRKVELEHNGEKYDGTIRNISADGALVEGLWNVPPGTVFSMRLAPDHLVTVTTRWSKDDRMGVEFSMPLTVDATGRIQLAAPQTEAPVGILRKAG